MSYNYLYAINPCGLIGPTFSSYIMSMPPSDAYTLEPYANLAATTRMGPPQLLDVDDLADCDNSAPTYAQSQATGSLAAAFYNYWSMENAKGGQTHPLPGSFYRCNPRFAIPTEMSTAVG